MKKVKAQRIKAFSQGLLAPLDNSYLTGLAFSLPVRQALSQLLFNMATGQAARSGSTEGKGLTANGSLPLRDFLRVLRPLNYFTWLNNYVR